MHSTMKENGQTEYSTDDDRSSTGSYKAKASKGVKTTYCFVCSELEHNSSKCKV